MPFNNTLDATGRSWDSSAVSLIQFDSKFIVTRSCPHAHAPVASKIIATTTGFL